MDSHPTPPSPPPSSSPRPPPRAPSRTSPSSSYPPLTVGTTAKNRSLPLEVTLDASKGRASASSSGVELAGNSIGAVNLWNGNGVGSWVIYDVRRAHLEVFLSHASVRPQTPTLAYDVVGLGACFAEFMFVSLEVSSDNNASSEGGFIVESWTFLTSGLPAIDPMSQIAHSTPDSVRSVPALLPGVTARKDGRRRKLVMVLGLAISLPIVFLVAVMVFVVISLKKWRRDTAEVNEGVGAGKPRQFMYQDIFSATKGFYPSMVVGSGGFGTVYKAVCPHSGVTYAVKRSKQSRESYNEFSAKLSIIADLKHPNLVQLQGWCTERDELLLAYEFMSNVSLDEALHPCSGGELYVILNWSRRYNVAVGIASAVAYLHEEHESSPRLGDFGLARLKDHDTSPRSTLAAGTVGYLAPEYLQMGKATEKSDIYSYGVVLLEICTGKRPIEREEPGSMNMLNVVDWVWNFHSKGRLLDAANPCLSGQYDNEQMKRLLLLGLSYVNPFLEERPVMRTVLGILQGKNELLPVPRKKPLLVFVPNVPIDLDGIVSECNQSTISSDLYELKIDVN
nr:probable L-type lectin-domain containing receptor kinase S.7 [Setaria viridis]